MAGISQSLSQSLAFIIAFSIVFTIAFTIVFTIAFTIAFIIAFTIALSISVSHVHDFKISLSPSPITHIHPQNVYIIRKLYRHDHIQSRCLGSEGPEILDTRAAQSPIDT